MRALIAILDTVLDTVFLITPPAARKGEGNARGWLPRVVRQSATRNQKFIT